MDEKIVLESVADTLVEKPVILNIEILHPTIWEKLYFRLKRKKPARVFQVKPLTLGSMVKISKLFLGLDVDQLDKNNILTGNYKLIIEHARSMAAAVAIAVVNSRHDPPESLINFFFDNLTSEELAKIVSIIVRQCRVEHFMISIISIKGTTILKKEMTPADQMS